MGQKQEYVSEGERNLRDKIELVNQELYHLIMPEILQTTKKGNIHIYTLK